MGTFSVEVQIRRPGTPDEAWTPVKGLVDTGAAFCRFSAPLLTDLGIIPDRRVPVILADGTTRDQPAAWLGIRYGTWTAFTLALVAGENGLTLLGAHALEGLGLVVDPVRKALQPGRFPLA